MKNIFPLLGVLLIHTILFSQTHIKGEVLSQFGEKLQDANVLIKGTTKGTKTIDGKFELAVKKGDTLAFSHLGYETQEIIIVENSPIQVILEVEVLTEVVIHAYGLKVCKLHKICHLYNKCVNSCEGVVIKTISSYQEDKSPVLYPNPVTNGYFNINYKEQYQHLDIAVYNTLGQLVFQKKEKSLGLTSTVAISNLKTGIYLVKVIADGKALPTLRAVVK